MFKMMTSKLWAPLTMFTEIIFRVHYEFLLCSVLLTLHASATEFNISVLEIPYPAQFHLTLMMFWKQKQLLPNGS